MKKMTRSGAHIVALTLSCILGALLGALLARSDETVGAYLPECSLAAFLDGCMYELLAPIAIIILAFTPYSRLAACVAAALRSAALAFAAIFLSCSDIAPRIAIPAIMQAALSCAALLSLCSIVFEQLKACELPYALKRLTFCITTVTVAQAAYFGYIYLIYTPISV